MLKTQNPKVELVDTWSNAINHCHKLGISTNFKTKGAGLTVPFRILDLPSPARKVNRFSLARGLPSKDIRTVLLQSLISFPTFP